MRAERSLSLAHRENERAGHTSNALALYLRLSALGSQIERMQADGTLTDPAVRATTIEVLHAESRAVREATRSELAIIEGSGFTPNRRAAMEQEEARQQAIPAIIERSLISTINGKPDGSWQEAVRRGVAGEELEIRSSQVRAVNAFDSAQTMFIAVAVAIALAAVACYVWFRGEVFAPLDALLRATRALGEGDHTARVTAGGPPEFREIGESFNTMAMQVAASVARMEDANHLLECQVRDRTAELAQANEALQRLNAQRRDFLADTSHELRTPLAVLTSEIDTALHRENPAVADLQATLVRAGRAADTMRRLVDDLLSVARAESPLLPVDCARTDLVMLVHGCIDEFAPLFAVDGGRLALAEAPPLLFACIDPLRIAQVLRIFIDNALKHSADIPAATFHLRSEGDWAVIALTDSGDGIAQDDLPALLGRFRVGSKGARATVAGSAAAGSSGMGLGLAIAATIAEVHGGGITITSTQGEGTTVTLRLPVAGPCPQPPDANARDMSETAPPRNAPLQETP